MCSKVAEGIELISTICNRFVGKVSECEEDWRILMLPLGLSARKKGLERIAYNFFGQYVEMQRLYQGVWTGLNILSCVF